MSNEHEPSRMKSVMMKYQYPTRKHKLGCSANRWRNADSRTNHEIDESRCICGALWSPCYRAAMFVQSAIDTVSQAIETWWIRWSER